MASFRIISGNQFEVTAELSTDAIAIFGRYVDGTATAEDMAAITDLGTSAYELRAEGEHDVDGGV